MITAADIRYATEDSLFQIKVNFNYISAIVPNFLHVFQEVELGLAADVGHLQRLPKITGNDSLLRELCFSARMFGAEEAKQLGKFIFNI